MIVIIATGGVTDSLNGNLNFKDNQGDREELIRKLTDDNWNLHNSVFVETYQLFDSRNSMSKINKLFTYRVIQSDKEGIKIIIIVPDEKMVDKRIRNRAIVLKLDQYKGS